MTVRTAVDPVASALREVTRCLRGDRSVVDAVDGIVALAVQAVDASMAGLTWGQGRRGAATIASSDSLVTELDGVQYRHRHGPCLEAMRAQVVIAVADTRQPGRWPEFCEVASGHGVRSSVSVPVVLAGARGGALNLYSLEQREFGDEEVDLLSLLGGAAASVMAIGERDRIVEQLRGALGSRTEIDQAKGIIMASTGCTPDEAFAILREQSQSENRKLREVAAELIDRHRPPA